MMNLLRAVTIVLIVVNGRLFCADLHPCHDQMDLLAVVKKNPHYGPEFARRALSHSSATDVSQSIFNLLQEIPIYPYEIPKQRDAALLFLIQALQTMPCPKLYRELSKKTDGYYQSLGYTKEEAYNLAMLFKQRASL